MHVRRKLTWPVIVAISWKHTLLFAAWCSVAVALSRILAYHHYQVVIPMEPISLMGIAVAFYLGFKNEKAFARFWEARTIWGGIVNYSRSWGNGVLSFLDLGESVRDPRLASEAKVLIYRHIAWLHALTLNLRKRNHSSPDLAAYPSSLARGHTRPEQFEEALTSYLQRDELEEVLDHANVPAQLLRFQGRHLRRLAREQRLGTYYHAELTRLLEELYNLQGACERIKSTPLPRQYAHTSHTMVRVFCLILPLALVGPMGSKTLMEDLLTIPITALVGWTFLMSERIGDSSEDPFENFMHDVPMSALSRTIEIDLREMIRDSDVPEPAQPENGILM